MSATMKQLLAKPKQSGSVEVLNETEDHIDIRLTFAEPSVSSSGKSYNLGRGQVAIFDGKATVVANAYMTIPRGDR